MWSIVRWLSTWIWTPRPTRKLLPQCGGASSHCGEPSPPSSAHPPQCGETATEHPKGSAGMSPTDAPQCGGSAVERAVETLEALREAWKRAADAPHGGPLRTWSPQDLASLFLLRLQSHPNLIGMNVHRQWIQGCYEDFCDAEGVSWPPPHKDFARELARIMTRKRKENWHEGQRQSTATWYLVPKPAVEVEHAQGLLRRA